MKSTAEYIYKLTEILKRNGAVNNKEAPNLESLFAQSSMDNYEDFLLEQGLVDKEDLLIALSAYYQVPYVDVTGLFFDHLLLQMFPKDLMLRLAAIPMDEDEEVLTVVTADPNDEEILSSFGECDSHDFEFRVGIRRDICDAIKEFYDQSPSVVDEDHDEHEENAEKEDLLNHLDDGYTIVEEEDEY